MKSSCRASHFVWFLFQIPEENGEEEPQGSSDFGAQTAEPTGHRFHKKDAGAHALLNYHSLARLLSSRAPLIPLDTNATVH